MRSVSMQTPATTIWAPAGAASIRDSRMPGEPTHSKITGWPKLPPIMRTICCAPRALGTPSASQRSCGDSVAGSMTTSAPRRSAAARRRGE